MASKMLLMLIATSALVSKNLAFIEAATSFPSSVDTSLFASRSHLLPQRMYDRNLLSIPSLVRLYHFMMLAKESWKEIDLKYMYWGKLGYDFQHDCNYTVYWRSKEILHVWKWNFKKLTTKFKLIHSEAPYQITKQQWPSNFIQVCQYMT